MKKQYTTDFKSFKIVIDIHIWFKIALKTMQNA